MPVKQMLLKGCLPRNSVAGHDHSGYPEEDDVGACDEVGCGVVVADFFVVWFEDAVEEEMGQSQDENHVSRQSSPDGGRRR